MFSGKHTNEKIDYLEEVRKRNPDYHLYLMKRMEELKKSEGRKPKSGETERPEMEGRNKLQRWVPPKQNIDDSDTIIDQKLNWDEYVPSEPKLRWDEYEEYDTEVDIVPQVDIVPEVDIVPKEPLYQRVLNKIKNKVSKRTVLGAALASLVLAPISNQEESRNLTQRQPYLEQLLDYEKEILQMPVKVKRELELRELDLYNGDKKIQRGARGFEVNEEDCLFVKLKFDHYGLRNRKLVFKQEVEPIGRGQTKTHRYKRSYSQSGHSEFDFVLGCNLPSGNYLLKSTIEDPKSGLSDRRMRRLRIVNSKPNFTLY